MLLLLFLALYLDSFPFYISRNKQNREQFGMRIVRLLITLLYLQDERKPLQCNTCGKRFLTNSALGRNKIIMGVGAIYGIHSHTIHSIHLLQCSARLKRLFKGTQGEQRDYLKI